MNFPSLGGNWIDLIIIVVVFFFLSEAFRTGFWAIFANFISFLLSLFIALSGYQFAAQLLRSNFALSHSTSNALGFFFTAVAAEGILGMLTVKLLGKVPLRLWKKWWSKALAILPAAGEGFILIAFILTLSLALPIFPNIKSDITESKIGGLIVRQTSSLEVVVDEIFGGVIEDSLTYFTVSPESNESIPITFDRVEFRVDEEDEWAMITLVNDEREGRGIEKLTKEEGLISVARAHALDMWERRYFGHLSPDGEDVGDRLNKAGISFIVAGENLAFAPTVSTTHTGLMDSPGHRENILDTNFKKVGIGVIDNGVYGKMFVQVFTD